jgi:hypothetical protein
MFKPNKYYQQNMQIDHHIVKKTIETRLGGILRHTIGSGTFVGS